MTPSPVSAAGSSRVIRPVAGTRRLRSLVRTLADTLVLEPADQSDPVPCVYTTALVAEADLATSLAGIASLCRELGFQRDSETCYAQDGRSASWHADHAEWPLSLCVDCNPARRTVSIAVAGLDGDLTYEWFLRVEAGLFGTC